MYSGIHTYIYKTHCKTLHFGSVLHGIGAYIYIYVYHYALHMYTTIHREAGGGGCVSGALPHTATR